MIKPHITTHGKRNKLYNDMLSLPEFLTSPIVLAVGGSLVLPWRVIGLLSSESARGRKKIVNAIHGITIDYKNLTLELTGLKNFFFFL